MKRLIYGTILLLLPIICQAQVIKNVGPPMRIIGESGPAPQNLMSWSEDLDPLYNFYAGTNVSFTADQANDMNGETTLDELNMTDGVNNYYYKNENNYLPTVGGVTYRFSFEVIRGTATELTYSVRDLTHSANIIGATSYYAQTSGTVCRVSFEFTAPAGCTMVNVYFLRDTGGTGTVYIGRAQVEENGSDYVKTTTTPIL